MKYSSFLLLMFLCFHNHARVNASSSPVIRNRSPLPYPYYPMRRPPQPPPPPLQLKPTYLQPRYSPYPENLPFPQWQRNLITPYPRPNVIQRRHITAPTSFNQLDEWQKQKAMRDVQDTIQEVERLLAQDPQLPRLTR